MKEILKRAKLAGRRLRALFPSKLPIGVTEFNAWADDIVELSGLPDNDSMRYTLAVVVLELPKTNAYRPKEFFIRALIKGACNQIVSQIMHDIRDRHSKKQAEVTAEVSGNTDATQKH